MRSIGIKATDEEYEKIKAVAEENGQSMSAFCKEAVNITLLRENLEAIQQEAVEKSESHEEHLAVMEKDASEKTHAATQQFTALTDEMA